MVISDEQPGFVKGRSMVKNVLLTQEIITDIRLRTKAGPNVVLKLDMMKAYDRLSWLFLTKVLRKMGFSERFIGLIFGIWSPKINHLAYADDAFIFSSSDATSLSLIMEVLNAYEAASGQLINKSKSAVYVHHSTSDEVVRKIEGITGIGRQEFPFIYLGCPIFYTRRKWIFMKASWDTLCLPKDEGGVGFRSLHDMSKALFCKLWWNFRTKPSMWISFMCQKYCKKMNAIVVPWRGGSHVWRKMLECRDLVEHQIYWKLKMGSSLFWFDNWTRLGALYFVTPPEFLVDETIQNVNDVVVEGQWEEDKIREILPEDLALHILDSIPAPSMYDELDKPIWCLGTTCQS
ncbi:PREDICTED: uncharacterized protein LOC109221160 [Nicotiana attenuata]|uniref:uncharacterized protein LOC109221160 n=1 Tax=Nicotiana attenuata TaxID=49451 RepID=UPI00090472BE|nr:PREDICTED: uncharacterized protein LOC109221160 [Nicotiana attenuata]